MTNWKEWLLTAALCLPATPHAAAPPQSSASGRYARLADAKLYYEECGASGRINVVLLHDGLLHSVTWDDVWVPLCAKYHVLRFDRRNYGRSDPAKAPFSPEDDLLAMVRAAKMDRAILVGNSSGSGLALDFALAHPEMTEGLLLIGPVVHGMASSAYFVERGNRASAPLSKGDVQAAAENWSRDRFLVSGDAAAVRKKVRDVLVQNPQNLKIGGQLETRPSPPTVLRLSQIQAPTLVLVGESDIADVIAYAGAIEAALPIAFFEVWKDAGHLIQLEHPQELVQRFERFARVADRKEAAVSADTLHDYVGQYKFFNRTIGISLRDNRLRLALPDTPEKWLFAASATRFFVRSTETEFEFERDAKGAVGQMTIHNADGNTINCPRV